MDSRENRDAQERVKHITYPWTHCKICIYLVGNAARKQLSTRKSYNKIRNNKLIV